MHDATSKDLLFASTTFIHWLGFCRRPTQAKYQSRSDSGFLHCDLCVIAITIRLHLPSNVSDGQINRGDFGAKFGKEGVNLCEPNFDTNWERHGAEIESIGKCIRRVDVVT